MRGNSIDGKIPCMHAEEFVRRFKSLLQQSESRFAFFVGSGCSVSSGIPDASLLVKQWLPKIKGVRTGNEENLEKWIKQEYPEYNSDEAAKFYGRIIEELFLTSEERQKEIERLTDGKDPSFGYAVLSQIISNENYGRHCNIILTSNFDDMVADALYLYTNQKPLAISHETLVGFVRISRTRPLVIKLHGDARLAPKNTELETKDLHESVKQVLKNILSEVGIIFMGYGGNDKSIVNILNELHKEALPWGVWWINDKMPDNDMGRWLNERNAQWVKHRDFDELMLLMWSEFGLKHPEKKRFNMLIKTYFETFEELKKKIDAKPDTDEAKPLKLAATQAVDKAVAEGQYPWSVAEEARKYEKTDPGKADEIYQRGLEKFSSDAYFLGRYAYFLETVRKDYNKAEELYGRAIELDPINVFVLCFYAIFLYERKSYDKSEEFFLKSIEVAPNYSLALIRYANFLKDIRKDYDKAEEFYKKSIEASASDSYYLANYAIFLEDIRKDYDKAEDYYKRAVEADPNYTYALTRYTDFLKDIRKDYDKAEEFYKKSIEASASNSYYLANYAIFLEDIRKDYDKAEDYYKRSIEANSNDIFVLTRYANFLENIRKDYDKAEELYKRAIEADQNYIYAINSYANFLKNIRNDNERAEEFYKRAKEIEQKKGE